MKILSFGGFFTISNKISGFLSSPRTETRVLTQTRRTLLQTRWWSSLHFIFQMRFDFEETVWLHLVSWLQDDFNFYYKQFSFTLFQIEENVTQMTNAFKWTVLKNDVKLQSLKNFQRKGVPNNSNAFQILLQCVEHWFLRRQQVVRYFFKRNFSAKGVTRCE